MSKLAAAGLSRTVAGPPPGRAASASRAMRIRAPDRIVEVDGAFGVREAGGAERGLERRTALADQDGGDGPLGDDRGERRQVDALVASAGDQDDRRLEGAQRGGDRVGLRALRIVDEPDAVDHARRFEAMFDAGEGRRGRADPLDVDPEGERDGDRGKRVRDVVGARDGELRDRHDPPGRPRIPGIGERESGSRPSATIQPSTTPSPPRRRAIAAVADRPGGAELRVRGHDRVLVVEHERAVGIDQLGESALDPPVRLERSRAGRGGPR